MSDDRHSIREAAEQMRSAVSVMQDVMRTAGHSELHKSGLARIDSDIRTLQKDCPELKKSILRAALQLRDDWTEIEGNKARLWETESFFAEFRKFLATTLQFDDWRQDCYDEINIFPQAHEIAMSLVLVCGECDEELAPLRVMFDELKNGGVPSEDPLEGFEEAMRDYCIIPQDGYLVEQIRHNFEPVFKAKWIGAKNELTLFGEHFGKSSLQLRRIFDFDEDKKTKQPFAMSKHPTTNLGDENRLCQILKKYPKEIFFK